METQTRGRPTLADAQARLLKLVERYDRQVQETKEREKRDKADYSWTWNYYEGKASAYRDAASMLLRVAPAPPEEPVA